MSLRHVTLPPESFERSYHDLFCDAFPETAGTPLQEPAHYHWKFGTFGKTAQVREYASYEVDDLLGYYAALPFDFTIGGRELTGGLVCDVMTHSKARGKGVFTELGRFATNEMACTGIDFVTGFPIRAFVIPGHLKVGWKVVLPLPVYLRVLDPTPLLKQKGVGWLGGAAKAICRAYASTATALQPSSNADVAQVDPSGFFATPEYAAFYESWRRENVNYMSRAPGFWPWRLTAPKTSYMVWAARSSGRMQAVAVARRMKIQAFDVLALAELMCLREGARTLPPLYSALDAEACREGVSAVAIMCTTAMADRLKLVGNGFFKSPVVFKLILKWLSPDKPEPATFWDMPSWHLTWLDTDTV